MEGLRLSFFVWVLAIGMVASATTAGSFVVSGQILKSDGSPLESSNVSFSVEIRDVGAGTCVLWKESFPSVDMTSSGGYFSLNLGNISNRTDGGAHTLNQVFSNTQSFSSASCSSYTPAAGDERSLKISFSDSGGATQTLSSQILKPVPVAASVGDYGAANLAKISGAGSSTILSPFGYDFLFNLTAPASSGSTPCLNGQVLQFQSSTWHCADLGSFGTVTFASAPQWSGAPSGANDLVNKTYVDAQVAAGLPNFGTAGTYTKVTTDAKGRVASGTILAAADIPVLDASKIASGVIPIANGGTNSGNALAGNKVMVSSGGAIVEGSFWNTASSNSTFVVRDGAGGINGALGTFSGLSVPLGGTFALGGATVGTVTMMAPSAVSPNYTLTLPSSPGTSGQVLTTNGLGVTSWNVPTVSPSSITNTEINASAGIVDSKLATISTPGKIAISGVVSGAGISVGAISSTGTGISVSASGSGSGMSVSNGGGSTGAGLTLSHNGTGVNAKALVVNPGKVVIGSPTISSASNAMEINGGDLQVNGNVLSTSNILAGSAGGSQGAPSFSYSGDPTTGIFFPTTPAWGLAFSTSGTERMRIHSSSGNIGINQTAPTSTLDVVANAIALPALSVRATAGMTAPLQQWQNSVGSVTAKMRADGSMEAQGLSLPSRGIASTSGAGQSYLYMNNSTNRVMLTQDNIPAAQVATVVSGSATVGTLLATSSVGNTLVVSVPGASVGDVAHCSPDVAPNNNANTVSWSSYVNSSGQVTVNIATSYSSSSGWGISVTFKCVVFKL